MSMRSFVMLILILAIAFFAFSVFYFFSNQNVPENPQKTEEDIFQELISYKREPNGKTDEEIAKELQAFKAPANSPASETEIFNSLKNATP